MPTEEEKPTIVIDVDNTIIDTAVRKQNLLASNFNSQVDIDTIRRDYHLVDILGPHSKMSKEFFKSLEEADQIKKFPAPAISGAPNTIRWFREKGFHVIFLTARPETCRTVTIEELDREGIPCPTDDLVMREGEDGSSITIHETLEFKKKCYQRLSDNHKIIAGIGDRPEDALAAQSVNVPAIILKSTSTEQDLINIKSRETTGIQVANSWLEIATLLEQLRSGISQMEKLRELFISQYSRWLYDVDEKIKSIIAISAILSTIVGHQLLQIKSFSHEHIFLIVTLFLSISSVLYSIRGLTSRRTSGRFASIELKGHIKQFVAILFGRPEAWLYRKGDAIEGYYLLRKLPVKEQASAHLQFFYTEYETYNPEALLNLRMAELRSAVYSKSYAERIASNLLIFATISLFLWIIIYTLNSVLLK